LNICFVAFWFALSLKGVWQSLGNPSLVAYFCVNISHVRFIKHFLLPLNTTRQADIESFMATYAASHPNVRSGERVRYLELEDPFARTAGSLDVEALPLESFAGDDVVAEGNTAISQAFKND